MRLDSNSKKQYSMNSYLLDNEDAKGVEVPCFIKASGFREMLGDFSSSRNTIFR